MRQITHIVIHCAATPNGKPVSVEEIDSWHAQRGFKRSEAARAASNSHLAAIGYHYFIETNGTIRAGRALEEIGAHVQGSNSKSIGICMAGTSAYSIEQWNSLAVLLRTLCLNHPAAEVLGHRDFSPDQNGDGVVEPWEWTKTCPGFDVRGWISRNYYPLPQEVLPS